MKVKLQEVLEALDGAGVDMEYYYDTKNEEIPLQYLLSIQDPFLH